MTDIKIVYNTKVMADPDKCVAKSVKSWQDARKYTQIALVAVLCAKFHSGDGETAVKRINTIVAGAQGANTKAIVEWGVKMGYTIDPEGKAFAEAPSNETIKELAGNGFELAKNLHWWDLKPMNPFEGYDLKKALNTLVAKANKMEQAAQKDPAMAEKIVIDEVLLSTLEELTSQAA